MFEGAVGSVAAEFLGVVLDSPQDWVHCLMVQVIDVVFPFSSPCHEFAAGQWAQVMAYHALFLPQCVNQLGDAHGFFV